jgi:large repetitive protein
VTFTVRVASASGPTPTGSVNFKSGGAVLSSAQLVNGEASFTTAALAAGKSNITSVYSGDSLNAGSTSAALTQTVH